MALCPENWERSENCIQIPWLTRLSKTAYVSKFWELTLLPLPVCFWESSDSPDSHSPHLLKILLTFSKRCKRLLTRYKERFPKKLRRQKVIHAHHWAIYAIINRVSVCAVFWYFRRSSSTCSPSLNWRMRRDVTWKQEETETNVWGNVMQK